MKKCKNENCTVENPEFYPHRLLCKKCFNKQCAERKRKKRSSDECLRDEIAELRKEIRNLTQRLDILTV